MKKRLLAATAIALGFAVPAAHAAGSTSVAWVSKQFGNDVAGCGAVTSPCRTFQFTYDSIVAPGGTIMVRDAGGYGPLVIKRSVSVVNRSGGAAVISAPSGNAIAIQAGVNDVVTLEGLTLDGSGTGATGVDMTSGANLTVTNCVIRGFGAAASGKGIYVHPSGTTVRVLIVGGTISDNAGTGVLLTSASAANTVVKGIIEDSVVSRNGDGVNPIGATASVIAKNITATHNVVGLRVSENSKLALTRSVVMDNMQYDAVISNGSATDFKSFGDNIIINTTKLQ